MISNPLREIDQKVDKIIAQNQRPLDIQAFNSITSLGSAYFTLILIGIFWIFEKIFIARQILLGMIAAGILIYVLKYTIRRRRPEKHEENVLSRASFPSGHSGNAFMTGIILSHHLGQSSIFMALALTVAFSRVYLEDHFLSDVMAGSLVGLITGLILITV